MEAEHLQAAQVHLPAPGDPHFYVGEKEPEQRQHAQAITRRQVAMAGEGRPVERHEEIDRDGLRLQLAKREGQVHHLLVGLAHAHQHTRAG